MLRRLFVLLLLVSGCTDAPEIRDLEVAVVDAIGGSPLTGRAITSVRIRHREGSETFFDATSDIVDGTFDLNLEVLDYAAVTELRIDLSSASGVELVGSTPEFYPNEGVAAGVVELVVGAPNTCDVVTASQLPIERRGFGIATLGTFALLIGGIEPNGPSERIGWHDLLVHGPGAVNFDLPATPGRSRAARISPTRALVISEGDGPFLYDLYTITAPRTVVSLHEGASRASAVLEAGENVAVAVGGTDGVGAPVAGVSFVSNAGVVSTGTLASALPDRVAAYADGAVYVVSRADGDAMLERVVRAETSATSSVLIAAFSDGIREGATLFWSKDGARGLLIGGVDENGDPRTDTVQFSGCPAACVTSAGPTWSTARRAPMTHEDGFLVGGEGASAIVERVVFGADGPVITARGMLENPRYDGGLLTHPSGALVVFGGEGATGIRRDVEMCFPPSID